MTIALIDIYNGALGKLGVERIAVIDEDSDQRIALDDQYTQSLEAVLEAFPWKFATKRVALAADVTAPIFPEDMYRFIIPDDCVRILSVWNGVTNDIEWDEEEGFVITDQDTFYIRYTSNGIAVTDFSKLFRETLEYKLAAQVALPLKQNRGVMETMVTLFQQKLIQAQTIDSTKRSKRKASQKSSWLSSRGSARIKPAKVLYD
ncbi:MAG: hypothetical protein KKC03_13610 [Bacteroidetes bacterium]|nr:hypothetical protein [Bacteroidota bacterium]